MKTPLATFVFAVSLCLVIPKPSHGVENSGNDNPTGVTGEYNGSVTTGGYYGTGDFSAGIRDVQFAEACYRSIKDGSWVKLDAH